MQASESRNETAQAWQTGAFSGLAVHGKLKELSEYTGGAKAPKITFEEFDRKLAGLQAREEIKNGHIRT